MAFQTPVSSALTTQLAAATGIRAKPGNPLQAMTIGLREFIERTKPEVKVKLPVHVQDEPRPSMHDMYYKITGEIAKGAFAQIFRCGWIMICIYTRLASLSFFFLF